MKSERCPPGAEPGVRIHSGAPDISFKSTLWRRMSLRRAIREILAEASRKQLAESHRPIWPATFFGAVWASGKGRPAKEGLLDSPLRPRDSAPRVRLVVVE